MTRHTSIGNRARRSAIALGGIGAVALLLTACGGATPVATPDSSPADSASPAVGTRPAASGKIAAVDANTIQVQSTDSQTTVSYTSDTAITAQVAATMAAITTGACVSITSTSTTNDGASADSSPVTAATVQIVPSTNGTCSFSGAGTGFGGGAGFGGANGTVPSGAPRTRSAPPDGGGFGSGRPTAIPSGVAGNFRGGRVTGTVTSVSGTTVLVDEVVFANRGANPSASSSPSTTTQSRTVDLTATTTYTTTQKTTIAALVVGQCASAQGKADSSGTVAATSIDVTDPIDGNCFGALIRRGTGTGGSASG